MRHVAIVGGGLAGGAAAALLADAGTRVTLVERTAAPVHKICGEFLSGTACTTLDRLGIDLAALGAHTVGRVRLVLGARTVEAALPFVAMGLTRRRLDAALLDRAARAGARIERGTAVRALAPGAVETANGRIAADTILLATGKHELRDIARDTSGCDTGLVGFKSYWRLPAAARAALAGAVEIVLFDGGYAGLQCVEDGLVNLCLLVRRERLAAIGGSWDALLAELLREPHLARRLGDGAPVLARPLAIAGVPYGFVHRPDEHEAVFRLGDQAAVIPSFCGDGMAIALGSGALAARTLLAGGDAAAYHRALARAARGPIAVARLLQRCGEHGWSRTLTGAMLAHAPALVPLLVRATRVRTTPIGRLASGAPAC